MQKKSFNCDWSTMLQKVNEKKAGFNNSFKDDRIYYPKLKEDGTGGAIIRFLPPKDNDSEFPWVLLYTHSIQGTGGWFIQNCPKTLNQSCPVCEHNKAIWAKYSETEAKAMTSGKTKKTKYFANILVVKDPMSPENEGKQFIFSYGTKIHDKILAALQPEATDLETPTPVFVHDYREGANFKFIIKRQAKGSKKTTVNYDSSCFEAPSRIGTDEEIAKIDENLYSLNAFISPDKFLTYDVLKQKYEKAIGQTPSNNVENEAAIQSPTEDVVSNEPAVDLATGDDESFFEDLQKA